MSDLVNVYRGERGVIGAAAINGTEASDIRKSVIDNPLLTFTSKALAGLYPAS